jgi:hypothetical protein
MWIEHSIGIKADASYSGTILVPALEFLLIPVAV